MNTVAEIGVGYARANWGQWVIDCSHPQCSSALTLGPDVVLADGRIRRGIAWGQNAMRCWDCDTVTSPIRWPADRAGIEMLLRMRPDVRTRNWEPGETLEDLLADNVANGIMPPDAAGVLMRTAEQRIVGGHLIGMLPEADDRRQVADARAFAYAHGLPHVEPDGTITYAPEV